jgi:capsid protein
MSLSEALRERGYDPETVLNEIADDNALLDKLGIILDSDPRMTTQAGNPRQTGGGTAAAEKPAPDGGDPQPPDGGAGDGGQQ